MALSAALVFSASALAADHAAMNADRAAIQALEDTYNEGFNAKDVDKVMSVYLPGKELFVFDVVPPREYKGSDAYRKDFEGLFAAFTGPIKNSISDQTIHVFGSLAYGHNIQSGEFTGKDGAKVAHRRGTQFAAGRYRHNEGGHAVQTLTDRCTNNISGKRHGFETSQMDRRHPV
jgi:ketosteroid isomerase-like protein